MPKMDYLKSKKNIADIMKILIDIFNLAELIGVYFIAREGDIDENEQQRFFFILFSVGGALVFKSLFVHPILTFLFSMIVESVELILYLTILSTTTSLLVVVIFFFLLEIMFHLISLICLKDNGDKDRFTNCAEDCCTLPVRIVSYGLLFETQIFFLFLDTSSPFRGTYYEMLMILSTCFGLSAIKEVARRCCSTDENDDEDDIDLEVIWQGILRLFIVIEAPIVMLTGVVYASQSLTDRSSLKTYDFAIYIITLITYGSALVALVFSLLCSLYLCAGTLLQSTIDCFSRSK
ncbi:unnamed protein product [Rotaria socialis]|uniref:Uncharacterized protein n=2 Tax=Rotaria socialis TaxID=392032 RepID=A0A821ERD5_9BILA|nr:unnamed protein product [Rotaria socialis]CAF3607751.1 unnamed protein product [Rotaria socialis]CAF4639731.1 unnamed protein product [Rotaria socialis]CAF4669411.1 unnamed protein product [Rotaria socialis]CAF4945141.1 unnamed protein product [Rotaria socialis]